MLNAVNLEDANRDGVGLDGGVRVRHASIVDLDRHEKLPVLAEVFRILNQGRVVSPQTKTKVALVLITRGERAETLILDVEWLEFAISAGVSQPSLIEGLQVPAPVILGTIEGWPSRWSEVSEDLLSVTGEEEPGSWRISIN